MRLLLLLVLAACTSETVDLPEAVFVPSSEVFFDTPWPSDARLTEGTPDWSAFPNPEGIDLLDTFLAVGERTPGFGTNSPIYFRLPEAPDPDRMPSPEATLDPFSPIQLIDVDPRSEAFGARIALEWESWDVQGTYVVPGLVGVAPVPGWPLKPRTTYALVVTRDLASPPEAFSSALEGDGSAWGDALRPLRDALPFMEISSDDIGVATVFTTGDPTAEMAVVSRFLQERVSAPVLRPELERRYAIGTYEVFRTDYTTPVFMSGAKPYAQEGGRFEYRDDGLPIVQSWDSMRTSVVLPREREAAPEGGWPVVVYLHGTGGTYRTFCNSSSDLEVATWLAPLGIVGIGIDLPLHGPRGTDNTEISLHSFNILQPDSALHIHRQAAADLVHLLDGLTGEQVVLTTPDGEEVPLDPTRVMVMGHSQGALTVSIALPFIGDRLKGVVISGGGGLLAIASVVRDDVIDFAGLIGGALRFAEDEPVSVLHPIIGTVQALVEPTDPINYAPFWLEQDGGFAGNSPVPILMMSGLRDDQTASRTTEALAAAAGIPFAGPRWAKAEGMLLRGLDSQRLPLAGNVPTFDGDAVTAGLSQWEKGTHFVVFEDPDARDIVRQFIYTTLIDDDPVIQGGTPEIAEP